MQDYEKQATFEEVRFNREKVQAIQILSEQCLSDLKLNIGQTAENFMQREFTAQLTAFVYSNTIDERTLDYYCERPTFFDWLFRRRKKVSFEFKAKDLLLNPPKNDKDTLRVYEIGRANGRSFSNWL